MIARPRCPRKNRGLGGYYAALDTAGTFLNTSAPLSRRRWVVGVTNANDGAGDRVIIGIVCAARVR